MSVIESRIAATRRILYVQYTNPAGYPPLEHSARILADEGWQVLFLGTHALGAAALRFPPDPSIRVRYINFYPAGWRQKLHCLYFCLWVLGWAIVWRPSWIYASDPLACPVALVLSVAPWLRVLYHEHDSPSGPTHGRFQRLVTWARRQLARRAECCVLPNESRLQRFKVETGTRQEALCVWNCPSGQEVAPARAPVNGDFWLLYHGSIVPDRLPLAVIDALSELPDRVKLRLIGYETVGSGGYVGRLQERARQLGVDQRLEVVGALPTRFELMEWCGRSDAGLALMPLDTADINQQSMTGASNKAFDYLACGLALLVSDLPDWRAAYVEPGYGLACDPQDPESIASAIQRFLDDPEFARSMGEKGRQRILKEWNYEACFLPVLRRLQRPPNGLTSRHSPVTGMRPKRILYLQYTNPAGYPPLEHSSRILADAGWRVLFLGTHALGVARLCFPPHPNIRVRYLKSCPAGWRQKLHYLFFCFWIAGWVIIWRPSWIYASDPLACPVALVLSVAPWLRVLYHEHDSPSGLIDGGFQWLVTWTRRRIAHRAKCCVLPNEARLARFKIETGTSRNVFCVWNCPSDQEIAPPRAPANGSFWLYHHGSIGPAYVPLAVVSALAQLPDRVKLRLIGYETVGSVGYIEQLMEHARQLGVDGRLEVVAALPRYELKSWSRRCDAGLALMPLRTADVNQESMTGASNKAFDYLASGLPLVVSDLPDWRAAYVEPGYALACDPQDPDSVAHAVRRFLDDPELARSMGEKGRQRILAGWNYEACFAPVRRCLEA